MSKCKKKLNTPLNFFYLPLKDQVEVYAQDDSAAFFVIGDWGGIPGTKTPKYPLKIT